MAEKEKKEKKEKKDNFFKKIQKYFKTLGLEMKKVTWPTRKELTSSTLSVIIYCVIVGVVLAVLDVIVAELILTRLLGIL